MEELEDGRTVSGIALTLTLLEDIINISRAQLFDLVNYHEL
jgi:hypothetical protein